MKINENWVEKKKSKPAGKVGKSPLKFIPSNISPKVFMLRNISSMRVKITSPPDKHCTGLSQTLVHERSFQKILVSQRQGHCMCFWATHLPNTVKPEQWVSQTENIKTLTRTSPNGLLLPRQWTQLTEPGGLRCFCSVPDLSQGERFGTKQMPSRALGRPLGPWTALLSLTALPWARELFTLWMLAMVYDFLVQILVAFQPHVSVCLTALTLIFLLLYKPSFWLHSFSLHPSSTVFFFFLPFHLALRLVT